MSKIEESLKKAVKMQSDRIPAVRKEAAPPSSTVHLQHNFDDPENQPHLKDYLDILVRRKWIILAFLVPVLLTVTIASFLMKPLYKSTATIQIKNVYPNITVKEFYRENTSDGYYETQYNILTSRNLAERVVGRLNDESTAKAISVGALMGNIEITPVKKSQLVKVSFDSHDPVVAAAVANTIADEYIAFNLESRLDPTHDAKERLEKEVGDMRVKLEESEQQLNEYITKNQIYLNSKDNVYNNSLTVKISDLSGELNKVVADRISREAIYQEVKKSGVDYSVVLQDPLIQTLTKDYIKLETDYFNLLQVHKPEYPRMVRLREQMDKLRERIALEEQKKINTLSSDYQLALKKERFLSSAIEKLRLEVANLQDKMVQMQILKREVDTNSELYNGLLQRLKEVGVSAALTESNVQVLDRAQVPRTPFKPRKGFNIALSLVFGLFGGVFLAFFVEYFDQTIRTPQDVEKWSRLPVLGMVPLLKENQANISASGHHDTELLTESFRSISTWIKFANPSVKPKQILVTSPLEGEGKTMVAINTAMSLLKVVGKGVIIDADFRRPCVHTSFDLDNVSGLSTFLSGTSEFDQLIKKSSVSDLDVITSGPMPQNPSEVLNSDRMRELLDALSAMYDFIVIDSAPLLGLSDSLILSASIDSVMLVVKAGQTPKDALVQTNKVLTNVATKVLGVVLNGTDIKKKYGYLYCHTPYATEKQVKKIPFIIKAG